MNGELTVFIVDDEQRAVDTLSRTLTSFFPHVKITGTAGRLNDAYEKILQTKPRLVFLDIEMGSENGFQLLEKFDHIDFHIAFVTAHEEFAIKAIKFSALDYIIKPAGIQDLKSLLVKLERHPKISDENKKVKQLFGNFLTPDKNEHKITVAIAEGYDFVKIGRINYLKADGSYTIFYLKDGSRMITSRSLKFYEAILDGYGFFRIHNSTLINMKYIKRINKAGGGAVIMENDDELSISKSRKDEFLELLAIK